MAILPMVIKEFKGDGNIYMVTDLKAMEDIPSSVMDNGIMPST
jgi:hypothetical protein